MPSESAGHMSSSDLAFALEAERARSEFYIGQLEQHRLEVIRLRHELDAERARAVRLDSIERSETWRIGLAVGSVVRPIVAVGKRAHRALRPPVLSPNRSETIE
jgi:hypothetical protein